MYEVSGDREQEKGTVQKELDETFWDLILP